MLESLSAIPGSRKSHKRVGRGPGSTHGKTCGRGHKGQNSRSGSKCRIGFEGGQMPLHRRLPKRGFTNIHRSVYSIINLKDILLSKKLDISDWITVKSLFDAGLVKSLKLPVKILGNGDIKNPLKIEAEQFSAGAILKIEAAGGTAIKIRVYKSNVGSHQECS